MNKFFIILKKDDTPVQSVHGEYVVFDSRTNAKEQLRKWMLEGYIHIYGNDTIFIKDLKIKELQIV